MTQPQINNDLIGFKVDAEHIINSRTIPIIKFIENVQICTKNYKEELELLGFKDPIIVPKYEKVDGYYIINMYAYFNPHARK